MARPATPRSEWLDLLPPSFSRAQALELGVSDWALENLRAEGLLEQAGRGWYSKSIEASADPDLLTIAARSGAATICLRSALSRHGLSDDIPSRIDIALPSGTRPPSLKLPIAWHRFDAATFDDRAAADDPALSEPLADDPAGIGRDDTPNRHGPVCVAVHCVASSRASWRFAGRRFGG